MSNTHLFPAIYAGLKSRLTLIKHPLFLSVILAATPLAIAAVTLDVQVAGGSGGRIVSTPGNTDCAPDCTIQASPQSLVSLFALPDKTYRFQGWDGACANTIGPLCTLRPDRNTRLSARFVKTEAPEAPTKALLLLHGEGLKHSVWNEFIKHRFNNRCPVIYGGVVLGEDSFDPRNNVYCYRIAFGYYDSLTHTKTGRSLQKTADNRNAKKRFAGKQLGYEVRAAVLGIENRHPDLSLTLVGQAHAALAAQSFLQADTVEPDEVAGLLALQPASSQAKHSVRRVPFKISRTEALIVDAVPEQEGKISAALAQLTKSWWMSR